ncbi:MAG: aspartyl protease family protein [Planctomycetota bacterium]
MGAIEEALAEALRADHADVGAYLDAHERFLWLGDWPRAERGAATVLALSPEFAPALALLSAVRFEQGRREEGEALSERALSMEADLVLARVGRAKALDARGDFEAATADLEPAIAIDPARPEARFALGAFLVDRNRYAEAGSHLEAVLEHEPDPGKGRAGYIGIALAFARAFGDRLPHRIPGDFRGVEVRLGEGLPLPAVRARLGGEVEGWMLIDTGSSHTRVRGPGAAAARVAGDVSRGVQTAAGTAAILPAVIDSLEIGGLRVADVPALLEANEVGPLFPGMIGALGVSLLCQFRATLDLQRGVFRLDPPGEPAPPRPVAPPGWEAVDAEVPFQLVANLPIVRAKFGGGRERTFLFDTGADSLYVGPSVLAEEFGVRPGDPRLRAAKVLATGGVPVVNYEFPLPSPLVFADRPFLGVVAVCDPGVEDRNRAARLDLAGTLGPIVAARYSLDFVRQRLSFSLASPRIEGPR